MPPKPAAPPKKLTKKEMLELQKEEQRKKEEEDRKRMEEEEKKRQEEERKRKELEAKLAEEERIRLQKEQDEVNSFYIQAKLNLKLYEKKTKEREDWEKYLQCSTRPDVTKESDITTYITQYKESSKLANCSLQETIAACQYTEDVVTDITGQMFELSLSETQMDSEKKAKMYREYVKALRDINNKKIDETTSYVLKNIDAFIMKEIDKNKNKEQTKKQDEKQKYPEIVFSHAFPDVRYAIWVNPNEKQHRFRPVSFDPLTFLEVPKNMIHNRLCMRTIWFNYDPYTPDNEYSKDYVVGGVFEPQIYDFLGMLQEGIKSWKVKKDFELGDSLKKLPYPNMDNPNNASNTNALQVCFPIPNTFYWRPDEPVRVACFDFAKSAWTSDDISELKYDPDKRTLSFFSKRYAPMAFLQERCTDFPYVTWKLRCIKDDVALLDIEGKRQKLRFEIGSGYVMLKDRTEPELAHLVNKKLGPGSLLNELKKCGINLMPVEKDAETANISKKSYEAECKAISDLCFGVRAFFIKFSRWNLALASDRILVRIKENPEFDAEFAEDQEKDWKSVVFWENKCGVIRAKDSEDFPNTNYVEGTETHHNLTLLLHEHELTTHESLAAMKNLDFMGFHDTLKKFLKLTRILSFTTG